MEPSNARWIARNVARRAHRGAFVGAALAAVVAHGAPARAAAPTSLPSDGTVSFVYSKAATVTGCSQRTEAEVRDLITGVVHLDPFVSPGTAAPFSLRVDVTRQSATSIRATFSLFDKDGGSLGTSSVDDPTCDGAHLKLAASIALLIQPKASPAPPACPACPEPGCDPACRTAVRIALRDEVTRDVRAQELPRLREEVRRELEKTLQPEPEWRAVIGAGALFGFNYAADAAPGFWLSGEARSERWAFGLEARGLFPTRALVLADGSTIDINSLSGVLTPCVRWRWLAGCALVEIGGFWVAGATAQGDPKGVLFSLGARARVDIPIFAGIEGRVFGDFAGHLVGFVARGTDSTGGAGASAGTPYAVDAPRRVSAFLGFGLARAF